MTECNWAGQCWGHQVGTGDPHPKDQSTRHRLSAPYCIARPIRRQNVSVSEFNPPSNSTTTKHLASSNLEKSSEGLVDLENETNRRMIEETEVFKLDAGGLGAMLSSPNMIILMLHFPLRSTAVGSSSFLQGPIFHDGVKEWSCCKKRSHDLLS
ncbi:unnamed protein product [Lupinus luteus]|uniref:CHORD domain-containing protein n=1 Tax=Lupinus luteus TaxID=3873 RepID=A0AAV1X7M6_LUPLU